ncbi:hypothetical protein DY000_02026561 [Brassica cretica]|uniref:Uncharacterized protein n=1 Tax=Brassica cretica TaxID=69181 RepID=A0ABQ7E522_BRACR|nr:hypothetical protein DY000_02026561 [Brassica cretica]
MEKSGSGRRNQGRRRRIEMQRSRPEKIKAREDLSSQNRRCVVMSFLMRYEEFTLIELPVEAGIVWDARVP